ncbi:MAG: metallophosphoesterase family protein [Paraclostridium sp.]|uniref:metallophosphoesterase family protein n=1 Tax=Paraclostridium sp. TaxID=2023273 RepID=UPI003EE50AB7
MQKEGVTVKIGLISDTHGMIRKEVLKHFEGCDLIIHAGDIGSMEVIDELKQISDVKFIKGNCDKKAEFESVRQDNLMKFDSVKIYVVHDIKTIEKDLNKIGVDIVIYGHSHKSENYIKDKILYINPGSAGPKRFKLPTTIAILNLIKDKDAEINLIEL